MSLTRSELRREYFTSTDERRIEIIRLVQEMSLEAMPENVCSWCKKPAVQIEDTRPLCDGHIYSEEGVNEFFISKTCEWCFDKAFLERDDPRREEWFGE